VYLFFSPPPPISKTSRGYWAVDRQHDHPRKLGLRAGGRAHCGQAGGGEGVYGG